MSRSRLGQLPGASFDPPLSELSNSNAFKLPRLPIPALEETARIYAHSCRGLAPVNASPASSINDDCRSYENQIEVHLKKLDKFMSSSGPKIQRLLIERDVTATKQGEYPFSFIERLWDKMYLDDNGPIPYTNTVTMDTKSIDPSWSQARVAAKVARACAKWFIAANEGKVPTLSAGPRKICLAGLANQFGIARRPGELLDEKTAAEDMFEAVRYVTIICKGQVFLVALLDSSGRLRSENSLNDAFETVLENATQVEPSTSIPILTASNRRAWFKARHELHKANSSNLTNLRLIEHSLIVLCLDSDPVLSAVDKQYKLLVGGSPESVSRRPAAVCNRWFDKHQFVISCTPGEGVGFVAEHSFSDGMMWWAWMGTVYKDVASGGKAIVDPSAPVVPSESIFNHTEMPLGKKYDNDVVHLQFSIDQTAKCLISKALELHLTGVRNLSIGLTEIPVGKEESKKVFKMSFDGFCFAVIQVAFARKHGFMAPAYKPASTAGFFHGRTETVRSATPEMNAFIRSFLSGENNEKEVVRKLRMAASAHRNLCIAATNGEGIDRHLFALESIAHELQDEEALKFFNDTFFKKSKTWTLSTTTNVEQYLNMGSFCPAVQDGYGISFFWNENSVNISTVSYRDSSHNGFQTDAEEMAEEIRSTAHELAEMLRKSRVCNL